MTATLESAANAIADKLSLSGLLVELFRLLDSDRIRYCVLHSYSSLPESVGSDLDLAVHPLDLSKMAGVLDALSHLGYRLVQVIHYDTGGHCLVLAWTQGDGIRTLALDLIVEHREEHAALMSGAELVAGRVWHGSFWIAEPAVEFQYLLAKKAAKGSVSREQAAQIQRLARQLDRSEGKRITSFLFGAARGVEVFEACLRGEITVRFRRNGLHRLTAIPRLLSRWKNPTGLFVSVLGSDGSGKSTLIAGLTQNVEAIFRGYHPMHWRPKLFAPHKGPRVQVTDPHGRENYSAAWSTLRVLIHLIDYVFGYWLRVRPLLVRSGLVVFDRYIDDMLVDPKRYRYGGPMSWLRAARRLAPNPELQLIMDAPEHVVLSRKQEQTPEELGRQRVEYRRLAAGQKFSVLIDASQSAAAVTAEATEAVLGYMQNRTRERYPEWFVKAADEPSRVAEVLQCFSADGGGSFEFRALPSAKNPRWLVGLDQGRLPAHALDLYQPYKAKAKVQKILVPVLLRAAPRLTSSALPFSLDRLASELTGIRKPLLTFAIGESSRYRKMTVQVMDESGAVAAYCKVPLTEEARTRVQREARMLARLRESASLAPHLPEVTFAGMWKGEFVLVQTPVVGRRGPERYSGMHTEFLEKLGRVDAVDRPGSRLVEEVRSKWQNTGGRSSASLRSWIGQALLVGGEQLEGVTIPCGISHGDFVPFNTRADGGSLRVFDWEAAKRDTPVWWDIFHFDTQVASLLQKDSKCGFDFAKHPGARGAYLLFLVHSVSEALTECPGAPHGLEHREMLLRRELAGSTHVR